jgi:uncharacterized protein (DUF1015 family)
MATLRPFRALRPQPVDAAAVAAVPYDVVTTEEARAQADGNPLSFLRVSRAELELPSGTDPYADEVYQRAVQNFERLKKDALLVEDDGSLYFYQLQSGEHRQIGVAGCYSLDEYDRDVIKKHERTRRDKEDDRTRHMLALGAQTGPVFMVYRSTPAIGEIAKRVIANAVPVYDFVAADGVRHTIWRVTDGERDALVGAFASVVPALYIADGHHRVASASRARHDIRDGAITRTSMGDQADYTTFLGVAFPHDQARILPYNRIVRDLGGMSADEFMRALRERFDVATGGSPTPGARGTLAMYFRNWWHTLRPRVPPSASDPIARLDVSLLHGQLLEPVLNIGDIRTDKRIDFVGGARGTAELERLVDSGSAAVAFSLYPVDLGDLMDVSDAGGIMPPKSTWFEPKLRDGLLIHLI